MSQCDEDEVVTVQLSPALCCSMPGCKNMAHTARAERDLEHPGLWVLMPLCESCIQMLGDAQPPQPYPAEAGAGAR